VRLVSVAVPVPFLDALTYSIPEHLPIPPVGARVLVEVGNRLRTGCVVETPDAAASDAGTTGNLKAITEIVDAEPFIPPSVAGLCRWVSEYYLCGIGDALAAAFPPGARHVERRAGGRRSAFKMRRVAALTAHGMSVVQAQHAVQAQLAVVPAGTTSDDEAAPVRLTDRQRVALEALEGAAAGLPVSELRDRGITADVLSRLAARGLVSLRSEADERSPFEDAAGDVPKAVARALTTEQAVAFDALAEQCDRRAFHVAMLQGVTGSGKTEIYLRLARRVCADGRRALLMVPEIALTPAVVRLFRTAFGDRVAIQHSALSDGERHDQWQRIRRGDVSVVVGTRSAVFAPLENVGLIIVDEEHDSSYKQEEAPRYHGRDVAVVRGSREGALVLLGSATPSLETAQNATTGKYSRHLLRRRVLDRPLAAVRIVNMRDEYATAGPDVIISQPLREAIEDRLSRQEQVVVLLNRRGYATAVFCRQCGDTFECPNCSTSLTVHVYRHGRARGAGVTGGATAAVPAASAAAAVPVEGRARCHYCNYSMRIPTKCRKCAAPYLEQAGFGTEKVEEQIRELFPAARVGRVDRDSVRRKGALTAVLSQFGNGELDVLVGTQMIAKGHDFGRVTLVGVISADVGLGMADFRAAERTFQLITQVAGRSGRGERAGEAIVQTLYPEHYSIQLAARQDYDAFFAKELHFRKSMLYPPLVAMVNVIVRGRTLEEAMQVAGEIAKRLLPEATALNLRMLGPAPAPLQRLRGEHRVQLFLKGTRRAEMRQALRAVLNEMPEVRRKVTVDVDPLNVL
jgi:primosomal protein N' (replication factor Y)